MPVLPEDRLEQEPIAVPTDLFQRQDFTSHAGWKLSWKIECDALTDEDIETFAHIISKTFQFGRVVGIPRGGNRLAAALDKYVTGYQPGERFITLLVDDVYTSGASMREARSELSNDEDGVGVVLFARRPPAEPWVHAIFQYWHGTQ